MSDRHSPEDADGAAPESGTQEDEPGIEFENIADEGDEPFIEMQATLTERGVRSLEHGSGTSWEFQDTDVPIDGLYVNSERELDRDWLLNGGMETDTAQISTLNRVIAGWFVTVLGASVAFADLIAFHPTLVGGVLALLGGIYLIEQFAPVDEVSA